MKNRSTITGFHKKLAAMVAARLRENCVGRGNGVRGRALAASIQPFFSERVDERAVRLAVNWLRRQADIECRVASDSHSGYWWENDEAAFQRSLDERAKHAVSELQAVAAQKRIAWPEMLGLMRLDHDMGARRPPEKPVGACRRPGCGRPRYKDDDPGLCFRCEDMRADAQDDREQEARGAQE